MRCIACDHILTDYEATRRFRESKSFVELCNTCVGTIANEVEFIGRADLIGQDVEEAENEWQENPKD